jgi:hypothetical protein
MSTNGRKMRVSIRHAPLEPGDPGYDPTWDAREAVASERLLLGRERLNAVKEAARDRWRAAEQRTSEGDPQ